MIEVFRNMWRRKFRTFLTVFGIVIGIFAFTLMGSMALKLNKMIDGGKRFITGQITIMPKGAMMGSAQGSVLPVDTLNKIAEVDGVKAVGSGVEFALDEPDPDGEITMNFGVPLTIEGMDLESDFKNTNWDVLDMKEGKMVERGDPEDHIAIGQTVALDKGWNVGDEVEIRKRKFKVAGIVAQTMTGPDSYVFMAIKPARELYIESNPFLKSLKEQSANAAAVSDAELAVLPEAARSQLLNAKAFKTEDVSTMAAVSWNDGTDSEEVANRIKDQFKNEVLVLSPQKMGEQIDQASSVMNAVVLGSAMLALVVGLFSIVNTMVMSITERTKEIGIKKALGASRRSIALEYTMEAGIIGLSGGIIGAAVGGLGAYLINQQMADKGAEIFLLEPGFFIQVLAFSFIIGILAGAIPAIRASRLNVVEAIREL